MNELINKGEKAHNLPLHGSRDSQQFVCFFFTVKTTRSIRSFACFLHGNRLHFTFGFGERARVLK